MGIVTNMSRAFRFSLLLVLAAISLHAQSWDDLSRYTILNFDKVLSGADKMIYVQPPPGKYWVILQGSTMIERPTPDATFMVWMENAPYAPYRDPVTGEMTGCDRCLTVMRVTATRIFYAIRGQTMPILISYPNRLMIAVTPHGSLDQPLKTWTRLVIVEKDLR